MIKILSHGGGLDSFAMLLDAIQRGELPDYVVFADTGSGNQLNFSQDGEWPSTYQHLVDYTIPLCEEHGITFKWITGDEYPVRGQTSLLKYFEFKSIIPTRGSRACTAAAKIERIQKWINQTVGTQPHEVWIGFEAGEEDRAAKDPHATKTCGDADYRKNRFVLIERGLCRCRAELLVRKAGYPVPRKSACIYCPFSRGVDFKNLERQLPAAYEEIVEWEARSGTTSEGVKLWLVDKPLPVAMAKKIGYEDIECMVCGRFPRASKATGIGYLSPEEYVQEDEPGKPALRYYESGPKKGQPRVYESGPKAGQPIPTKKRMEFYNPPDGWVSIQVSHNERALAFWLVARLGVGEVTDTHLVIPSDSAVIDLVEASLDNYVSLADFDVDRNSRTMIGATEALWGKIVEAAR